MTPQSDGFVTREEIEKLEIEGMSSAGAAICIELGALAEKALAERDAYREVANRLASGHGCKGHDSEEGAEMCDCGPDYLPNHVDAEARRILETKKEQI